MNSERIHSHQTLRSWPTFAKLLGFVICRWLPTLAQQEFAYPLNVSPTNFRIDEVVPYFFKVRGPFVETFYIEKDPYMDAI